MKILQITPGYPPPQQSGTSAYTRALSEWLAQKHEVVIFCGEANEYSPNFVMSYEIEDGVKVYRINMAREQEAFAIGAVDEALRDVLKQEAPDIVHIEHLNHLSLGLPEVIQQEGIPQICTLHDYWYMCPKGQFIQHNFHPHHHYRLCEGQENYKCASHCYRNQMTTLPGFLNTQINYWSQWVGARMEATRKAIDCMDLVVAPSAQLRDRYVKDFPLPAEKIRHLPIGLPSHKYLPIALGQHLRPYTFGFRCANLPGDGVSLLLEAFGQLTAKARLLIFGIPYGNGLPMLKALAEACPLQVQFLPDYKHNAIREEILEKVDSMVVPSLWMENSPVVIHEAQACGIPVITANAGGMAELVRHQENGLLFEHRDVFSLAEQLAFAVEHPREMIQMGQRGNLHDPKGQVPSLEHHGQTLLEWYEELIQQPHAYA